ncbi:MAG: Ig-like domain-containing protein, partial [Clostridia bacterium]
MNKLKMLAMFLCVLLFAQNIAVVQATEPTTLSDPQATLSSLAINEQLGDGSSSVELTVTGTYSDNSTQPLSGPDLVWRSSDPNVATVNTDGNVTFTGKNGAVTITVSYQNTDKTASVQTTVSTGMSLSSFTVSPATLDGTSTVKLTATGQYSLAGSPAPVPTALDPLGIVWKSSNDAIATVDSKGVVTLKGIGGTVSIDATYQ